MVDGTILQFCCGCVRQRIILGFMTFLGIAICYMMRNCISVAITEMVEHKQKNISSNACPDRPKLVESSSSKHYAFDWSEKVQGYILGSFYYGYVITHIPGGIGADYLGGKHVFGGGVFVTAIVTLLSPSMAKLHYGCLIAMRVIAGLASGVIFPAVNVLLARWVPLNERGRMGGVIMASTQMGNVFANALSGIILDLWGWPAVFYFFGVVGLIWYLLFLLTCYSEPASHPYIKEEEKAYIEANVPGLNEHKNLPPTPFASILLSVPVWAIIVNQFGHDWGLYTMQNDLPKYMKNVLGYSTSQNGFLSALPFLAMWLFALLFGVISDFITKHELLSLSLTRKSLSFISQVGPGCGCLAAVYAGCHPFIVVGLFTLGMALMGPHYPSQRVNALDLSPNYAGFLMAVINGLGALAGSFSPMVIGYIVEENSFQEWQLVFWISCAILTFTAIFYSIFASVQLQKWNNPGAS